MNYVAMEKVEHVSCPVNYEIPGSNMQGKLKLYTSIKNCENVVRAMKHL